ncbi:hypothetical protein [Acetivibrio cellulolyticus]|uniref:hypothetical protein n=1 Tax=Acetivibrio cellulolyticus TaxID=35830 RepID=UPI0001E2E6B9|nr:hypothetical protein [Acetivibrio cellulolyticus]
MGSSYIPVIISIIGLVVAIITFILTFVRPAKLICKVGPYIKVHYTDFDKGRVLGLYIPVTFINTSNRIGVITKSAISITRTDSPDSNYYTPWKNFSKVDGNKFVVDEISHCIAISGKSSGQKNVRFAYIKKVNFGKE